VHIAYLHYLVASDTAQNHVRQFVEAVRSLGHRVDTYSMNLHPSEVPDGVGSTSALSVLRRILKRRFSRYVHELKELLWNCIYIPRELAVLRRARPDVLLVRDHLFTMSSILVARCLKLPLVLEVNAPAEESSLYLDEYLHLPCIPQWLESYKLRRAGAIVTVSSTLKELFKERYGLDDEMLSIVPNGADPELFHPGATGDAEMVPLLTGGPVIGFVGSFHKWHGSRLLCHMLQEVASTCPAARFLLVGDGPEAEPVRRAAASLGDRAIFTGNVPHERVPGLVATFDIGVLPDSHSYGSPLKVIEWMMAGKAILAPRYAPLLDVIENGVHGLLFPPGDGDALVRDVLRLLGDPGLRHRLGEAAAARARTSLSWQDNARRVLQACDRVLRRGASVV